MYSSAYVWAKVLSYIEERHSAEQGCLSERGREYTKSNIQ